MSDNTSNDDKKPTRSTLSLRPRGGPGTVKQSFSHGRSNNVVVETKKRRIVRPGDAKESVFAPKKESVAPPPPPKPAETKPAAAEAKPAKPVSNLSSGEMDARARALEEARQREAADAEKRRLEEERRAHEDAATRAAREKAEQEAKEEEERKAREAEAKKKAEEEAARQAAADASAAAAAADKDAVKKPAAAAPALRPVERPKEAPKPSRPKGGDDRRRTKLTLSNALNANSERSRSLASMRRQRDKQKRGQSSGPREKVMREVTIPDTITISELANRMSERAVDVVKLLMEQGQMMKPGDIIDADMAQLITEEMGHTVVRVSEADADVVQSVEDDETDMVARPPVVTIMGHVDHGKTSLLDSIREARVAAGEAGGITQHIGAYQIEKDGKKISFLDTPGHEVFTAMRARGAQATDIAVLVVAADDSVMPQTIESIKHAKAAEVPMIVAINKMDAEGADAQKVRTELLQHEVFVEGMGGEVLDVEVSAKTGDGIDNLLDAITLQSELLELKANPDRDAEAVVIEAKLEKGRGSVATVIVQRGTLRVGDIIVAGSEWGRVRALLNDHGKQLKEAGPATPVEILGLSGAPSAGDLLVVVEDEARAREISDYRQRKARELAVAAQAGQRGSLEQMMSNLQAKGADTAPMVIKADTQGSVEAIVNALEGLGTDEVQVRVVSSGVGGITEADVTLAVASETPLTLGHVLR
ncbi:MAG: translation initiation factor IF-2, partial [Pseudomonadota bacterium]